jgi:hypothetical protein
MAQRQGQRTTKSMGKKHSKIMDFSINNGER